MRRAIVHHDVHQWQDPVLERIQELELKVVRLEHKTRKRHRVPINGTKLCFKLFELIWLIMNLIGCFWQLYDMVELYMSYEMNVETISYPTDTMIPPSVIVSYNG